MNKKKRLRAGLGPFCLGLAIVMGVGCGSSDGLTTGANLTAAPSQQTVNLENDEIDDQLEELPTDVLSRAADDYPGALLIGSTNAQGQSANGSSFGASLSADGKYLAFVSNATNLTSEPTNSQRQIYRKNLETGEIVCVSREHPWSPLGDAQSYQAHISDNGKKVAFSSLATNLTYVDNPNSTVYQVYQAEFWDTPPGQPETDFYTELVSRNFFASNSAGSGHSQVVDFAGDEFLAFRSRATDLSYDDTDNKWDLFYREGDQSPPTLISQNYNGKSNGNSNYAALLEENGEGFFASTASNLANQGGPRPALHYREQWGGSLHMPVAPRKFYDVDVAEQNGLCLVATERNDANTGYEVYYYKAEYPIQFNPPEVKLSSEARAEGSAAISDDGRFVVYEDRDKPELSDSDGKFDIFVYDAEKDESFLVSGQTPSSGHAYRPAISDDGSTIAWDQGGRVWVVGNPALGANPPTLPQMISSSDEGIGSNGGWQGVVSPQITADGRWLTFASKATNIHPDATSGDFHLYRKDLFTGELTLVSRENGNNAVAEAAWSSLISNDGNTVIFQSPRPDLGDYTVPASNWSSTYVRDLEQGTTTFLFNKARILDLVLEPYMPSDMLSLIFYSYGSENDHSQGVPEGLMKADLAYSYFQPLSEVPGYYTDQYGVERVKVSDDGRYVAILFSDTAASPDQYLLYRIDRYAPYYQSQMQLVSDQVDFQHFDMSADGLTMAYTERDNFGQPNYRHLKVESFATGYSSFQVSQTQATHPHLSADGRYLLYYDTNYAQGSSQGSGANAYVYDTETHLSLPLRDPMAGTTSPGSPPLEAVTYPGSLRLSDDGRSVIFEDYDYSTGTQLYVVKNPHLDYDPANPPY